MIKKSLVFVGLFFLVAGQGFASDPFVYPSTIDMNEFRGGRPGHSTGGTYLRFMEEQVKPAMDVIATEGYAMCDGETVGRVFDVVGTKVQRKVTRSFGGIDNVKAIADQLVERLDGRNVTATTLPQEIRAVSPRASIYDLASFYGMACGGGVKILHAEGNYSLNVHYDVTEQRSGRSFGVGPTRGANDASDKEYLSDLASYSQGSNDDLPAFYSTMFQALLNTDGRNYSEVAPDGQTVLTDFLAVYTAEQARNLMDGHVSPHWDAALLEVTLLAGFHAGQDTMKLYYKNPATGRTAFTGTTLSQTPCATPTREQSARLSDYWQFSRNITDPSNCKRSGINITKTEFRKLGQRITAWVSANHSDVFEKVNSSMGLTRPSRNLYESLSMYLIGANAPRRLTAAKVREINDAWVSMLTLVTENANEITAEIVRLERPTR